MCERVVFDEVQIFPLTEYSTRHYILGESLQSIYEFTEVLPYKRRERKKAKLLWELKHPFFFVSFRVLVTLD